jgi:uncharacterized membrane protein YgcG
VVKPPRTLLVAWIVATLAALTLLPPSPVAAKSFELPSLEIDARLQADGSMLVTERVVYEFDGGPFNFGIKSFERDLGKIIDFTAADDQGPLAVIPPAQSVSGSWEWELREPTSDTTVPFTLTYRVFDAVTRASDVGDLNWAFLGSDHPGIGSVRITVTPPAPVPAATGDVADDDTSVLRGFAHGPTNGVVTVEDSLVVATVDDLDEGQFVEVRVVAPASVYAPAAAPPQLAKILEQERSLIGEVQDARQRRDAAKFLTPLLALLGLGGTASLWYVGGRERTPTEVLGEYWREPLDDPPAIAITTIGRGTLDVGKAVAGTLVDLAQRGYIRITSTVDERIGKDKHIHHYQWLGKAMGPDVRPYEHLLLELVFRGQTVADSESLDEWAKDNRTLAKPMLDRFEGGVKSEYNARNYDAPTRGPLMAMLFGLCLVVGLGSFFLTRWADFGLGWVGVGFAVVCFLTGATLLRNRTQAGVEAAAKAEGLKKYLEDFSRLEDAPVGHLILWERYLVYSVALGVSGALIAGLASRLPQVLNDPNFGSWYVGTAGMRRWDDFDSMETRGSSLVTAATPNQSGSGGGFSGGSSGGGGGGGFGAR